MIVKYHAKQLIVSVLAVGLAAVPCVNASDWTTWRADSARTGYTPDELPEDLVLQWSRYPEHSPAPAWPRDDRMSFDRANHVVVAQGLVCFGSSVNGTVKALDATTGAVKWTFFTEGPIRFAPTVWKNRLYAVSDDGYLYALQLSDGSLIDRWRGGPQDDRVLGNTQMISKWPARGGAVIHDGLLYWGAGIWQSEGVFIRAMNPDTGETVWTNDSSGGINMPQPHGGANAKSGVSAQGYLLANDERLFIPTGRAVPAAFKRGSGEFEYYRLQENTKRGGTTAVLAGELIYNGGYAYRTGDGSLLDDRIPGAVAALSDGIVHGNSDQLILLKAVMKQTNDRKGQPVTVPAHETQWQVKGVPAGTALIAAGETLVSSNGKRVATASVEDGTLLWSAAVDDVAYGLAVSDEQLFVSTASGAIHCYGGAPDVAGDPVVHHSNKVPAPYPENPAVARAAVEIIKRSGVTHGYCVDLGCGDGQLAYELTKQSDLFVVAVDSDADRVATARKKLHAAGVYGTRVTVHVGSPSETHFPKYFANLVVSQRSLDAGAGSVNAAEVFRLQRPYGGVACVGAHGSMAVNTRGALEGAGEWTHLYSNPANTLCSTDTIKGPLSAVWFRDINLDLPQRHGRGPSPLFYEGRLFAEGLDELIAVDAYNGHPLWRVEQKGILDAYNADHLAGTAVTGSNICVAEGSVFIRNGAECLRVDAATGKVSATFHAPPHPDGKPAVWGYIACEDGVLFGSTSNEAHVVRHAYIRADDHMQRQFSESTALFAFDVATEKLLWRYDAKQSIRHNAIAIGAGHVHLIDRALAADDLLSNAPARRGQKPKVPPVGHTNGELITLDAKTGERQWKTNEEVFGTTLAFSADHDIVLMFYQSTRFKLPSEVGGRIAAYHATDGYRLWEKKVSYSTRPLINDDTIIAHPSSLDLVSGEAKPMAVPKSYGCGQLSGSRNLLMFRSGTLGYFDFSRDAGTENYGGIRPGCWINALPVGGLVLLPDASSGCSCSYQNRSWMALEGSE
ncbi:MAG: PQQ-binding-like beta-propeller repeat protein [Fuerstiella sp.]|nr:PQQ-binding-like beta-propeller repeat protein [Fuerstiella sp.]